MTVYHHTRAEDERLLEAIGAHERGESASWIARRFGFASGEAVRSCLSRIRTDLRKSEEAA